MRATAEDFLCELDSIGFDLGEGNHFLVGGAATEILDAPSIYCDTKRTVTIHDAGEICKIDFSNHSMSLRYPRGCRYYFDQAAISEEASENTHARAAKVKTPDGWDTSKGDGGHGGFHREGREKGQYDYRPKGGVNPKSAAAAGSGSRQNASFSGAVHEVVGRRNKRSVWTIPAQPYSEAHFATYPERLVEPCVLAGSRPGDTVFDPFMGSGTTAVVAERLGRQWLGCELVPEYLDLQRDRLRQRGLPL